MLQTGRRQVRRNPDTDASAKFPLTVTDANGDAMTLENPPQRIVSLTLGSDEILLSLVDKSRIVSLTRYADDEGISNIAAEAKVSVPGRRWTRSRR